jgi:hypothetical protein
VSSDYDWGLTPEAVQDLRRGMVASVAFEITPDAALAPQEQGVLE